MLTTDEQQLFYDRISCTNVTCKASFGLNLVIMPCNARFYQIFLIKVTIGGMNSTIEYFITLALPKIRSRCRSDISSGKLITTNQGKTCYRRNRAVVHKPTIKF
ncbi:hypothetical protein TrispH2_005159 [Trichoplax sp. H2]|nr:hypothetical protein TrispH2_005159 [Trichoplax sp. H2]|eukprot:RDD41939.1 hypothetical protein TrispH2_005159 [Trichoplax sp. H2]